MKQMLISWVLKQSSKPQALKASDPCDHPAVLCAQLPGGKMEACQGPSKQRAGGIFDGFYGGM